MAIKVKHEGNVTSRAVAGAIGGQARRDAEDSKSLSQMAAQENMAANRQLNGAHASPASPGHASASPGHASLAAAHAPAPTVAPARLMNPILAERTEQQSRLAIERDTQLHKNALQRAEQASNLAILGIQKASQLNRPATSAPAPVGTSFGTADTTQSAAYQAAQAALRGAQQAQAEQDGTASPPPTPGQAQPVQTQTTPPVPAQAAPAQPAAPAAQTTARANVPVADYTPEDIAGVYASGGRVFTGFGADADGFSSAEVESPYDDPLRSYMFSLGGGTFA